MSTIGFAERDKVGEMIAVTDKYMEDGEITTKETDHRGSPNRPSMRGNVHLSGLRFAPLRFFKQCITSPLSSAVNGHLSETDQKCRMVCVGRCEGEGIRW